jgi:hypothetical protein
LSTFSAHSHGASAPAAGCGQASCCMNNPVVP